MEGLIASSRYHCHKPVTYEVAEQLLGMPELAVIQYGPLFKPDEDSLETLNEVIFKKRNDITLRVWDTTDIYSDIGFLNFVPDLEKFDWHTTVFGSIEPFYKLKRITHLGIGHHHPKPKLNLSFLGDFKTTIKSLTLEGDYKEFEKTISLLYNLKSLWLTSIKVAGFEFTNELPLEVIGNYGSRIASFDFLAQKKSLKKIWLKNNPKITNVDFIENLANIEEIEFLYIPNVKKFPKCDHLKRLKKIFAFQCNGLEDIEEVKKLKDCNVFISGKSLANRHYKFIPDKSAI